MDELPKLLEGDIVLYRTAQGATRIEVVYQAETFWLNQKKLAELFGVDVRTISYHLKEIFASGELSEAATVQRIRRVRREGNREVAREIEFYNLDAIISVGYRVNSSQATRFRIWATQTLREFVTKGFVLDDERLKLNKRFGKDYFDELLERIREIRASERRFYLKITDIYEQCSVDHAARSSTTGTTRFPSRDFPMYPRAGPTRGRIRARHNHERSREHTSLSRAERALRPVSDSEPGSTRRNRLHRLPLRGAPIRECEAWRSLGAGRPGDGTYLRGALARGDGAQIDVLGRLRALRRRRHSRQGPPRSSPAKGHRVGERPGEGLGAQPLHPIDPAPGP